MKRLLTILIFLLSSIYAGQSKEQFIYKQISQKDGLTYGVNCIYKERDGDVWIGTPNGLYTFNGHDLRQHNDSLFTDNRIRKIEEDKEGGIWVLTDDWLMLKRKGDEHFTRLRAESHRKETPFYSMCQDDEGIWFGSYGSIYRYSFKDRKFSRFSQPKGLEHFTCIFLNRMNDTTLLCSSNLGSYLVNTDTGEFTPTVPGPIKEVSGTMTDSQGRLWIAFYNHGIRVYGEDGTLLKAYTTGNSALSNNVVMCFTEKDGKIWAGTDGGGVNIIDPETDSIRVLSHVSGDASSFPAHSIRNLYTDHYGNIWVGSTRDGLIKVSQSDMKTYKDCHIGLSSGLSNPSVLCLFQEKDSHMIWVGTDCEGLNRFDPKTGTFTHYRQTLKTKIVSIATYSETELALSVYANGIWIFDKNTGSIRPMAINDDEFKHAIRHTGRRAIIVNGKNNDIYFLRQAVQKYDRETGLCHTIPLQKGAKSRGHMSVIGESERGPYLHDTNGIYRIDEDEGVLLKLGILEDDVINSGYPGTDGDIWLATRKGLCRFNENTGELSHIDTRLFSKASAVVCDKKSRVWIGSGTQLYAYLTEEDSFAMFGESDGALLNEYMAKPRLLSDEGDVYIGGVQGLLHIDSGYTIDASEVPGISLYDLSADRQRIYAGKDGVYEVPGDAKLLNISISTHETDIFRQKMYRFIIQGSGKEYEQMSPSLEIQELPDPGKYDILVSCTRRNGEWTKPVKVLTLRIPAPWYLSGWFIASVFAFILTVAASVVVGYLHRKASRLQLALKEQEQKVYEEKVKMLINISHELRTPLTLIMAPLKRLLKETGPEDDEYLTLGRIYRQSQRMKDLLDIVLELRKLEVGQNGLKIERADFNSWLSNTVADVVNEEVHEGIIIETDLDQEVGDVDFDRRKCDTVLMNILINAIKHSCAGDRITISTRLTPEGCVRVSICDEGPGLKDINQEKMFTRFYQGNSEQYGSGIGLSYSRILVELHGGRIAAENNPDKGATFWWEIPVRAAESATEMPDRAYLNELMAFNPGADITVPESDSFSTSGMTLLLVDDNQDLLDFLQEALSGDFKKVLTATSGNDALRSISSGNLPDIIVSDVNMPDGDGYLLCHELKNNEKYSHIPFILLTARGEAQSQSDSYKLGADAFLAKPFEIETLTEMMRGLLRRRADIRRKYLDADTDSSYGSNEEKFILELNRIIAEHLSDRDLNQKLICNEMGVSRAALYNHMRAITGAGAKEYITRIRLEKAKTLIETSSLSVAEISDATGFASQSYFSTAFKAYTGMTPTQYKKDFTK